MFSHIILNVLTAVKCPLKYVGLQVSRKSYKKGGAKLRVTPKFDHDLFVTVFAGKLSGTICSPPPKKQKRKYSKVSS